MDERTGKYEYRAVRYRRAIDEMLHYGLDDSMTIIDMGAGMTEFDYCLRAEYNWRGRYIPIDGGIDGTDIQEWTPKRDAHWFVALELVEHLNNWDLCVDRWKNHATKGIVLSTPHPYNTDVLGMDPTHVCAVEPIALENMNFKVSYETFYGGAFNLPGKEGQADSLFGVWTR
jgi:hypothetical protein